jgi:hypothetical protein
MVLRQRFAARMRIIRTEIKPFTMQESGRGAAEGDSSNNDLSDLGYYFLTKTKSPPDKAAV